jgi:hypothetical protein
MNFLLIFRKNPKGLLARLAILYGAGESFEKNSLKLIGLMKNDCSAQDIF